jgi:predicted ArsR family transcriptional regulator
MTQQELLQLIALNEPISARELAGLTGVGLSTLHNSVRKCWGMGLVHVAEWERQQHPHRGRPAPKFAVGAKADAPRLKPIPKRVRNAKSQNRNRTLHNNRNRARRAGALGAVTASWIPAGIAPRTRQKD